MAPPGRWRTLGVDSESSTLTEERFLALMGERGTGMRASSCPLDPVAAPTPEGNRLGFSKPVTVASGRFWRGQLSLEDCRSGVATAASPFLLASEFQLSSSSKHT